MTDELRNTILTSVIIPVIVALVPFLLNYLNKLSEEAKAKINDQRINKYIDIAEDAIVTAVIATNQTFVDSIKGTDNWDEEAQNKAFETAKNQAILIMGSAARQALKEVYGDLDAWIDSKIQAYVNEFKTPA